MFHFNEPMPDCVPEYYRAKEEAEAHEYEMQAQQQERFERNRRKMEDAMEAGYPILPYCGYPECDGCPDADDDTMTDADDDFCRVICRNPACLQHKMHQSEGAT